MKPAAKVAPAAPKKPVGAPAKMVGGRRINLWLDADTIAKAAQLGGKSISEGIRKKFAEPE